MYINEAGRTFGEADLSGPLTKERVEQVVRAIYRLPEGTSAVGMRDYSYELRIVKKLERQGFSRDEIEAGLTLTRKELGLPGPPKFDVAPRDRAPRMGPAEYPQKEYDRATARNIDRLYARAQMGDEGAADELGRVMGAILRDLRRMEAIRRELTELRSPAAIVLRVPPEPPAPTPDPPKRWRLPPRPMPRR
jgi:hypothetical protein